MGDSAAINETVQVLPIPNDIAAQFNRDLMLKFQNVLQENPAADLMSLIPTSYRQAHEKAQYRELSHAGLINHSTINELRRKLRMQPEIDLLSAFPPNYLSRIRIATDASSPKPPAGKKDTQEQVQGPPEFRKRLETADTAKIVFPLSEEAKSLLARYPGIPNASDNPEYFLASSLKSLIWNSPKIWENASRGVVVRGNDDVVIKVITKDDEDYTEYTSMQYLSEHLPELPAPRGHGMIQLGVYRVIFMTYIPGMTLTEAWPKLAHDEKVSIQCQLDKIFRMLRTLRQSDGNALGGVGGEGVKEYRLSIYPQKTVITTAREFSSLQFSKPHHGSRSYIAFLCSFLADENAALCGSVFTHGDFKKTNIMVTRDQEDGRAWTVTGIIDWEDSGFYPEYYESTTLTGNLSLVSEDDWYLYLPESISPLKYPVRWLVDRLWDIHLKTT